MSSHQDVICRFTSHALFPHTTVRDSLSRLCWATGLFGRKYSKPGENFKEDPLGNLARSGKRPAGKWRVSLPGTLQLWVAECCCGVMQELRAHCAMLVRTHNALVEERNRLLLAAGFAPRPAASAAPATDAAAVQPHGGGGSDHCSVMPETPEHEAMAAPAGSMPALQLSSESPAVTVGTHTLPVTASRQADLASCFPRML